jgi:hypothetical protein
MPRRHVLAYGLIAFGVLALLANAAGSTGWLWLAVVAAVSLAAYVNTRTYAFLLLGGVLAGSAVGVLLTEMFACDGVFLVSLGAGLIAVDLVEPRTQRWATYLGAVLAAIGLLAGLIDTGVLGSAWLPVLLIAVGVALLWRERRGDTDFPPPLRPVPPTAPPPTVPEPPAPPPPAVPPGTVTPDSHPHDAAAEAGVPTPGALAPGEPAPRDDDGQAPPTDQESEKR